MPGKKHAIEPQTTAQSLASLIKSCRDIMRKDKGLSTDIDRLPMLTWIMFLKFLDDMEDRREVEAKVANKRFLLAIESPYRWRDWAAKPDGITGDALIAFINNEEAILPNGKKGPGLFAYLRSLHTRNGDRRDIIAAVFHGTTNRMTNGYLLRDVVNKVSNIHFNSTEEMYTLGQLYESMLKEMRDAAGENGEFYTPRPVVKFIVTAVNPRLGETVLDPACGTGGFLASAYEHMKAQCKTAADQRRLQRETLSGIEAKPLPYLLCQMNLLLHGMEYPVIDPFNALRVPLREIGEKDRIDVIMTNPPFGGEEEKGIQGNFPEDKKTGETALLFLQLIMRKLRKQPKGSFPPARAAVVVPNGTLFGDGVCARIKEELLKEFNLHTIVRLPNGVFSPYTNIPTNILFFDRSGPAKEVWYYEHPLPEGRKNYTKTQPIQFDEFAPCLEWWSKRKENERAWKVPASELLANNCNLDRENPNAKGGISHLPPEQLAESILRKEQSIAAIMANIKGMFVMGWRMNTKWPIARLGDVLQRVERFEPRDEIKEYSFAGTYSFARGIFVRERKLGSTFALSKIQRIREGDFVYCKIMAWEGAFGLVPREADGCVMSGAFVVYELDHDRIDPKFLEYFFKVPAYWQNIGSQSSGTNVRRQSLHPTQFEKAEIPLPPLAEQRRIVALALKLEELKHLQKDAAAELDALMAAVLDKAFKGEL